MFSKAAVNTLLFTAGSIAGQFTIGLALAVYFQRRFPLSGVLRSLLLLPWLIPLIVASTIWRWILDQDNGAFNRVLAGFDFVGQPGWLTSTSLALIAVIVVNIWIGIPFNATILYGGLQDIPRELYEAAALDGATGWKAFRHITWPLLRPVVNVVLVLGVVYTLKVIDIILGLTRGGPGERHADDRHPVVPAVVRSVRLRAGGGDGQHADRRLAGVRGALPAGEPESADVTARTGSARHTFVAVLILAVFLFPLYWMFNVSLQESSGAVATPWLPTELSLDGYSKALRDQGGHLLVSLAIALGTVVFSLLIAAPASYALAQLRIRGAGVVLLVILISQMIPGIVVANALYTRTPTWVCSTRCGV